MDLVSQSGGFLTLLKKRNFLRLWLAQLISLTIFNASNYALLVLIGGDRDKGSTTQIGIAIICFSVPAVLFGAPAGVFVDHMDKRRVLWVSNCLRALATFLFVITLLLNRGALLPIYLLTFIISTISQFFIPAEGSSIPMLVDEKELAEALSLFNITLMLSQALGYILLPTILLSLLPTFTLYGITIDSVLQLYIIVTILYTFCAFLITSIPKEKFERSESSTRPMSTGALTAQTINSFHNVWNEMVQGWGFVRTNKPLFLAVMQLSFAGVLILVIGELATPIVTKLLFLPADAMAFVFAPAGIGLVGGSVLVPRITKRLGGSYTILRGVIALTVSTLMLPLAVLLARTLEPHGWNTNLLLLLAIALFMFSAGVSLAFVNVPAQTTIQELTPDWIKGRVLALQLVLYNAFSIPVILFIGVISDLFGIDRVLYIMAGCELAFGIWGVLYERKYAKQFTINDTDKAPQEPELVSNPPTLH